jgi:hypothetical protein
MKRYMKEAKKYMQLRPDACRSAHGYQILEEFLLNRAEVTAGKVAYLCLIEGFRSIDPYHRGEGTLIAALLARFQFRSAAEACRLRVEAPYIMPREGEFSLSRFIKSRVRPVTVVVVDRKEGRDPVPVFKSQGDPAHGNYPL